MFKIIVILYVIFMIFGVFIKLFKKLTNTAQEVFQNPVDAIRPSQYDSDATGLLYHEIIEDESTMESNDTPIVTPVVKKISGHPKTDRSKSEDMSVMSDVEYDDEISQLTLDEVRQGIIMSEILKRKF